MGVVGGGLMAGGAGRSSNERCLWWCCLIMVCCGFNRRRRAGKRVHWAAWAKIGVCVNARAATGVVCFCATLIGATGENGERGLGQGWGEDRFVQYLLGVG